MTEQELKLKNEYLTEISRTGRAIKHVKYGLKIFFTWLKETDTHIRLLKTKNAEEFQVYLTTSVSHSGAMRFTRASVLNIMGCVANFYDFLRKRKYIYANPFDGIDRVRRSKALPRNILNEQNMDMFLKHLKKFTNARTLTEKRQLYKAHVIAELMYSTGMRVNETASLKDRDVDFIRGIVTVFDSKTRKKREAILNSFAEKVLYIYVNGTGGESVELSGQNTCAKPDQSTCAEHCRSMKGYVLSGKGKQGRDDALLFGAKTNLRTWLNEILDRESNRLGLGKFTTHNFRHAVGYHLLRGGCDIRFIQEILGHEALHSTQVYTKIDKEDLKNVIDTYHPRQLNPPLSFPRHYSGTAGRHQRNKEKEI